jgi:hypothetical protein
MFSNRLTRIVALLGMGASFSAAYGQGITVEVNGERVYFPNTRPQMVGGRVLVPLRGVMEQIGAYVNWDPASRMVTAQRSGTNVELRIGDRLARVDGRAISLDVPAMIIRGSTMVPLRFMSEALGADVSWMAHTQTVRITTDFDVRDPQPPYPPTNPPAPTAVINTFRVGAPGGILRSGDMIRLELIGTPGAEVSYSLPGIFGTRRMREERPGVYVAEFTVPSAANGMRESEIIARLYVNGQERTMRGSDIPGDLPPPDSRAPRISSMEPANGERVYRARPTIQARVDDQYGSGITDWRLFVDGEDVTDEAVMTSGVVRYVPRRALFAGTHTARLEVEDRAGNRSAASWQFIVNRSNIPDRFENTTFTHNASTRVRPGDVVTLTLRTEPDADVTYSVGSAVVNRQMTEVRPGVYTATYTVRRSDDFWDMPITARVRTRDGQVFTVDATRL